jgi:hypothetical protein
LDVDDASVALSDAALEAVARMLLELVESEEPEPT